MKRIYFFVAALLCLASLKAQKDTIWNQPYSLELQFGQLGNLQAQPLLWDALDGFYLRRGNDIGIRFASRLSNHLSAGIRYKFGVFSPSYNAMNKALTEANPNYGYSINSTLWTMNQLHAGLAFRVPKNHWCFEAEQYLGLSIINAPYLAARGSGSGRDTINFLVLRKYQQVPAVSFYTSFALKYFIARRVHIFARAELGIHLPLNPIETDAVFGTPDYRRSTPDPIFQISGHLGVGWLFGKQMPEKLFKRRNRK